jgi:hypothetical protein
MKALRILLETRHIRYWWIVVWRIEGVIQWHFRAGDICWVWLLSTLTVGCSSLLQS